MTNQLEDASALEMTCGLLAPAPRHLAMAKKEWERKERAPRARLSVQDGNSVLSIERPDDCDADAAAHVMFSNSLGSTDEAFSDALVQQLVNSTAQGGAPDPKAFGFALSVVQGIEPRDQIEGMLAAQMAAVHVATMIFARRLAGVQNIPQQDSAERAFNKLARTYVMQVEALKRYRTGGEQRVTVQHVSVHDGGQAVVGAVTTRGEGRSAK